MDKNKDIFGKAIKAFYENKDETDIIVHSPDFEDDVIPVKYLFRDFEEMPKIEQEALNLCKGKVLDVGCGAGSHSLYLQEQKDLQVEAIDTSILAIEIARRRGVQNADSRDFFALKDKKFDTILMLMNGSGIIGKLANMEKFFDHAASLLKPGGQILMDSSDLIYLNEEDYDNETPYYGELEYRLTYKKETSDWFDWLYIDEELLGFYAKKNGFNMEIAEKGEHFDFLAILKKE